MKRQALIVLEAERHDLITKKYVTKPIEAIDDDHWETILTEIEDEIIRAAQHAGFVVKDLYTEELKVEG